VPPWGILAGLSVVIASFAALIIGIFIATALLNVRPYTTLAGWTIGALLTVLFLFIRFRSPEERAALWSTTRPPVQARGRRREQAVEAEPDIAPVQEFFLMMLVGVGLAVALDVISGRVTGIFLPEPELLYLYQQHILYGQTIT
ncbi:hypothetical protein, partial [Klebsiella pneumoniae]|uniref:hypothetical protein n=1 Tax=Klebsiella pneumoniae TaxID=573 RepID=UPI001E2CE86A